VSLPQTGDWQIQVFNLTGKVIFDSNMNGDFVSVNSGVWPGGIYLIKATSIDNNKILTHKLIIE
jgi:hypothetical protein